MTDENPEIPPAAAAEEAPAPAEAPAEAAPETAAPAEPVAAEVPAATEPPTAAAEDAAPASDAAKPAEEAAKPAQPAAGAATNGETKAAEPAAAAAAAAAAAGGGSAAVAEAAARAAALAAQFAASHSAHPESAGLKRRAEDGGDAPGAKQAHLEGVPGLGGFGAAPGGEITEVIDVARDRIGKLIGRGGSTITFLVNEGRCQIKVDHDSLAESKPVRITGTPENVQRTRQLINSVLDGTGGPDVASAGMGGFGAPVAAMAAPVMAAALPGPPGVGGSTIQVVSTPGRRTFPCPVHVVGRLIGRSGETIRGLQNASGAHITVNQNFPEGHPREIELTGAPDSVERAYAMCMEIISTDGQATNQQLVTKYGGGAARIVHCPKSVVGRIIGKGGETIKQLQKQFDCSIQIDQSNEPVSVSIQGPPHQVPLCERAVIDLVEDRPSSAGFGGMPGGFGGFGAPAAGGFGAYGAAAPSYGSYGAAPSYGAAAGGYGGYGGAPAAGGYGGGSVWREMKDDQNRSYYYNTQTGVSQWERPVDM